MPLDLFQTIRIEALVVIRDILFDGESSSPLSDIKVEFLIPETEPFEEGPLGITLEGPLGGLSGQIIRFESGFLDKVHNNYFWKSVAKSPFKILQCLSDLI